MKTPSQNLMSAVLGIDQPIGIPEYEQAKMFAIIERALTADEVELLRRGYGFGQKRQSQKEISTDMGIDYRDVSRRAHTAIKKLQASPYKNQLKALIPTVDDLLATISELKKLNEGLVRAQADPESVRALKHRLQQVQQELTRVEAARRKSEADKAQLEYEINQALKATEATKAQLAKAQQYIARLTSDVVRERARVESIQSIFNQAFKDAQDKFKEDYNDADPKANALAELNLSIPAAQALRRAGIYSLDTLCTTSIRSLSKLGVGKHLGEIKAKLFERGITLRDR